MNSDERPGRREKADPSAPAAGAIPVTPGVRRQVPPDDRHTVLLPPVAPADDPQLRDPIDAVKAALDGAGGKKPPTAPPPPPPAEPKPAAPASSGNSGGRRRKASRINWKLWRRLAYAAVALMLVLPLITFGMAYVIVDIPKPGDIRTNQVSTILASDGSELAKIVPPEGNRVDVNIDQIPVHVRNAVMAAEDRDFYTNPGFSFSGFARAFKNNIFGGDLQGGSTITQQYVKNALVGDARSGMGGLMRKAKELVISTKMSREWSKDQVMEAYLNIIYFGRGAYGISAASQAYFHKSSASLAPSEAALLAGAIINPRVLNPYKPTRRLLNRQRIILGRMGAVTPPLAAASTDGDEEDRQSAQK